MRELAKAKQRGRESLLMMLCHRLRNHPGPRRGNFTHGYWSLSRIPSFSESPSRSWTT